MYSLSTVKQWSLGAKEALNEAKELCNTADTSISTVITNLLVKLPQNLEQIDASHHHLEAVNDLVSHYIEFLDKKISDVTGKYASDWKEMERLKLEFEQILTELEHVKVPDYLIRQNLDIPAGSGTGSGTGSGSGYPLQSFISMDEITVLFHNISVNHDNVSKLHGFLEKSFESTVVTPFQNVISKKTQQFTRTYDELVILQNMNQESVQKVLKENEALEMELVSLLGMLTRHYDQCMEGVRTYNDTPDDKNIEEYELLHQDALESPNVLKHLKSVYDIIITNEIRGKKVSTKFDSLVEKCQQLSTDLTRIYGKFKSTNLFQIIIFMNKYHEMDLNLPNYIHIINQLIYYYKNFLLIYKTRYLTEYHFQSYAYPKKFLAKLNRFLNDELFEFQQQEKDRRSKWLAQYGEFIPQGFKLPGEDQPTVVQVITEGLDELDGEDRLLELISEMDDRKGK